MKNRDIVEIFRAIHIQRRHSTAGCLEKKMIMVKIIFDVLYIGKKTPDLITDQEPAN